MSADEVAYGFLTVANEAMTRPIRSLTEAKGHDTSKHRLATFGGAGGQHAVAIAQSLGIKQILVHRYSSVLSAYGMVRQNPPARKQEVSSLAPTRHCEGIAFRFTSLVMQKRWSRAKRDHHQEMTLPVQG